MIKGPVLNAYASNIRASKIQEAQNDKTKTNPVCRNPSKSTKSYENVKH